MNKINHTYFDGDVEEGKYFLVFESQEQRKNMYIFRTQVEDFDFFTKKVARKLTSYGVIVYECFSGFGAIRSWYEDINIHRYKTEGVIKNSFVRNWVSGTTETDIYELTPEEVNKHIIMDCF